MLQIAFPLTIIPKFGLMIVFSAPICLIIDPSTDVDISIVKNHAAMSMH
jgi:hypothetical protein